MSTGLREVLADDLDAALEHMLAPRLASMLADRRPGHCMRVDDLDADLASKLCRRLRATTADAQVHVLAGSDRVPASVAVTSTKLVELRNPLPDGRHRPALLVFVPPGSHASAEDSFGAATFEQVELGDVYTALCERLLDELPSGLRPSVDEFFAILADQQWRFATSIAKARYLLTVKLNDYDLSAAGAAVFELGLVPDFDLFTHPSQLRPRAGHNLKHLRVLTDAPRPSRQRVIELGLADATFRARLAELVSDCGLEDPRGWTRRIVVDRANWSLAFGRWPITEDTTGDKVRIEVRSLDLPRAGDRPEDSDHPILQTLTGQPYVPTGPQGLNQFPVTFRVAPEARQIPGLARFTVQLIGEDTGPTGVVASVRPSQTGRTEHKATLRKLKKANLEEGWHFVRVLPLDFDGIPLPVEKAAGSAHAGESERVYVVPGAATDEPPQQRARTEPGVTQALYRLRFGALAEGRNPDDVACTTVSWKTRQGPDRHVLHAVFGANGVAEIPLAPALTTLQHRILAAPDEMARWRWRPGSDDGSGHDDAPVRETSAWPQAARGEALEAFHAARGRLFHQIRGDDDLVVEGCELSRLRDHVRAYAQAYADLLSRQLREAERSGDGIRELIGLLELDTVTADFADHHGGRHEVVLVAPTHPLRLLWLVTWSELGGRWLETASDADAIRAARDTLLNDLSPLGFPLVIPRPDGRLTVAAHDVTPYWGACLPTETEDPQGLLTALAEALRVPNRRLTANAVSGRVLADRVERYLRLHPYVGTLTIAAINAGRADQLADMLVELQRRSGLRDVGYDVRLFLPDPDDPDGGAALAELLRGEWSSADEAEAFRTPTASGLHPKLAVAVRPLDEFRSASSDHAVHITLLFDAFSGEQVDAAPAETGGAAPVHGLVQDMTVTYVEDDETVAWHKQPKHGHAQPFTDGEELTDLLAALPTVISHAAAAVSTGQVGTHHLPRITLALDVADRTLLQEAHHSSDWVVTIDRTLGVEFFDSPGSLQRPEYVIDYGPSGQDSLGHHIVISSRSVDELRAMLAPALTQHHLAIDPRHAGTFFDQLRQLSGRLAFKLASATPTQRTEVLGLALARLYLDYQGALADQILMPLDAHLDLYRDARRRADEIGDAVGLHRTDLALFDLDAARRTITCRLVEVKCLSSLDDLSAYVQLKNRIVNQLDRSADVLSQHFDPQRVEPDRPDRSVKNAELAALLGFYLDRAARYHIITSDVQDEARWLLDCLDDGYRLEFTRTGIIFDLSGTGTDTENEGGVEFHRIGRDLVRELVEAIPTDPVLADVDREREPSRPAPSLAEEDLTLPRLPQAAFRTSSRDRLVPDDTRPPGDDAQEAVREPTTPAELHEEPSAAEAREPAAHPPAGEATRPSEPPSQQQDPVPAPEPVVDAEPDPDAAPDVFTGVTRPSPQYGILGEVASRLIALDLNETHTISLFGVQGGGKSYTLGSIIEMASLTAPPANRLPQPLATIVFHYSPTQDYAPEFTSMVAPNDEVEQVRLLRERYGVQPRALRDVVMLAPEDLLAERREQYPGIHVLPLKFGSAELRAEHWRFLMGAVGNQSTYIRQLQRIMRAHRSNLRLDVIRDGVDHSNLPDHLKQLAQQRLDLASDYIDDQARVKDLARPGRVIIVDLRDEFIEKDEALGLFVVLMQLFADARDNGRGFNKLVVFDEAHKYIDSPDLVAGLVESVREMRHKGLSVLIASQDPPSVPISLIELSDHIILHKFTSPAWLKHLQKANAALADLTPTKMASLGTGDAYLWSSKATDPAFTHSAVKIRCRPRITRHGGNTKTAIELAAAWSTLR